MRNRRRGLRLRPSLDELDDRCLLSGFSPLPDERIHACPDHGGLWPRCDQLHVVDRIDGQRRRHRSRRSRSSRLYHDPNIQSDLATFDAKYQPADAESHRREPGGKPDRQRLGPRRSDGRRVGARDSPPAPTSWLSRRRRRIPQTQELQNLLNAVNTARSTAGVVAVSMSWGFNEMQNESSFDSYFTTPTGHQGVTFIAASGDNGDRRIPRGFAQRRRCGWNDALL